MYKTKRQDRKLNETALLMGAAVLGSQKTACLLTGKPLYFSCSAKLTKSETNNSLNNGCIQVGL